MRFGCCCKLDQAQVVQEAGYDYLEFPVNTVVPEKPDEDFEPVREKVLSFDIVPEAWNCLLPSDLKVTGPEVDNYRLERFLRTVFERIEELSGEVVVFGSGGARKVPDGFSREEAKDQIIQFVTLAGQLAGIHGINIAIEPLNTKETNIINSVKEGVEYVEAADHPFVKVLADLYHVVLENEPISDVVEAGDALIHTHTADTGRYYPGSGSYDHSGFFEGLRSIGYNDRMSVECTWRDFPAECGKALVFLRTIDSEIPW